MVMLGSFCLSFLLFAVGADGQYGYGGGRTSPPPPLPPPSNVYPPAPTKPVQRPDPVYDLPGPPAVPDPPWTTVPDYQSSINNCADVFETFASNREHKKYSKLFKKIGQRLRKIQYYDIDKNTMNELYPSLNRLNQAATYSRDCAQTPISSDFYEFLYSRVNEDDEDDDKKPGRGRGRGRNQSAKIRNLLDAASECLEDYCRT
ncbi:hypothetical protein ANCCAN_14105 [Ancylostoma caninum]|uniref:Uncharacterized protein n=1 Tax=Ancylostoma caninum TaxID=29170 RepID=A0A368G6B1_ANCCA|nr:hypothetical protein ANCCAN_14105 [Ancylostoma caninum]